MLAPDLELFVESLTEDELDEFLDTLTEEQLEEFKRIIAGLSSFGRRVRSSLGKAGSSLGSAVKRKAHDVSMLTKGKATQDIVAIRRNLERSTKRTTAMRAKHSVAQKARGSHIVAKDAFKREISSGAAKKPLSKMGQLRSRVGDFAKKHDIAGKLGKAKAFAGRHKKLIGGAAVVGAGALALNQLRKRRQQQRTQR